MGPHGKAQEHLTKSHLGKMIAHTDTLETPAHIFDQTCFLEGIYAICEIDREIGIMEILYEMNGRIERRIPVRILHTGQQKVHLPMYVICIISFNTQTCRQRPAVSPLTITWNIQ